MQPPVWAGLGGCGPGAAALAGPVGLAAHAVGPQRPWALAPAGSFWRWPEQRDGRAAPHLREHL